MDNLTILLRLVSCGFIALAYDLWSIHQQVNKLRRELWQVNHKTVVADLRKAGLL